MYDNAIGGKTGYTRNAKRTLVTIARNNDTELIDVFNSTIVEDPLETITKKEYYKTVGDKIEENLSDFEKQVLHRYARGESYVSIAEKLDSPVKSIDNAIQRIRKKAGKRIFIEDDNI